MIDILLSSIYFILPAYIANTFPNLFALKFFPLKNPINQKLFGAHKTWRGFYLAYIGAFLTLLLQLHFQNAELFPALNKNSLLDYQNINLFLYAFLFGIGAVTGDLVKSFFKRRIGIKPGAPWFPFDQLDLLIGALIFIAPFYLPPWQTVLTLLIITPPLHLLTNIIAYLLRLKKVWW